MYGYPTKTLRNLTLLVGLTGALTVGACGKKGSDGKSSGDKSKATAGTADKAKVPKETAPLALDTGGGKIPAIVTVPKGCTIFVDEPTTLRVSYKKGLAFGLQITKGNEFNTTPKKDAKELGENKYGVKNKVLEVSDTLIRYTQTSDGLTTHKFSYITTLKGVKWVCSQGNFGGWTAAQAAAQLAACKTLKAK